MEARTNIGDIPQELYLLIASFLTSARDRLRLATAVACCRARAAPPGATTYAAELARLAWTWRLTLDRNRIYSSEFHVGDRPSPHWDVPRTVAECRWALLDGRATFEEALDVYVTLGGDEPAVVAYLASYFGEALPCDSLVSRACCRGRLRILRYLVSSATSELLIDWPGRRAASVAAAAARAGDADMFEQAAAAWSLPRHATENYDRIDMSYDVYAVVLGACQCGDHDFYRAVYRRLPRGWLALLGEHQWHHLLSEVESFAPPIRADVLRHYPTALPAEGGWLARRLIKSGHGDYARTLECPRTFNVVATAAGTGDFDLCRWAVAGDRPRGYDAETVYTYTDSAAVAAWAAAAMTLHDRMRQLKIVCAHGELDKAVATVDAKFRKRYRSTRDAGYCVAVAARNGWLETAQWAYDYFELRWDNCFDQYVPEGIGAESVDKPAFAWLLSRCTAEGAVLPEVEAVREVVMAIRTNSVATVTLLLRHPASEAVAGCPSAHFWDAVGTAVKRGHVDVVTWYLTASPWRVARVTGVARDACLGWLASARTVAIAALLTEHLAPLSDAERACVVAAAKVAGDDDWDDSVAGARVLRWLEVCR